MKFFTKRELKGIGIILFFIFLASFTNFRVALRRARDAQRRADLGVISNALLKFQADFGFFPLNSDDGKIKACKPDNFQELLREASSKEPFDTGTYLKGLKPCEWGEDSLRDLSDDTYLPYLSTIPRDSRWDKGISYRYLSNERRFQIYTHLEGEESEIGYNQGIVKRQLNCGEEICNYGKVFGQTPLDKSIEEYENELLEKSKLKI